MLGAAADSVRAESVGQDDVLPPPTLTRALAAQGELPVLVALNVPAWQTAPRGSPELAARQQVAVTQTQEQLLTRLAPYELSSVKDFGHLIPFMGVTLSSPAALTALAADPAVSSIAEDTAVPPDLFDSVPLIRADLIHGLSYAGEGWAVAVLDTGVDKNHSALSGKVVAEACFSSTTAEATTLCPDGSEEMIGPGAGEDCPASVHQCYHGTHVAGIAAGVAPAADLVALQVFSQFGPAACGGRSSCVKAYWSDILQAMAYVAQIGETQGIASVNLSLGSGLYSAPCQRSVGDESMGAMVVTLRAAGIATVVSAGNDGARDAISSPACIEGAISVGATDKQDAYAYFTNVSPYVTVLAPGVSIYASVPDNEYRYLSGTSMAAPHVAGAVALLRSVLGERVGAGEVVDRIQSSLVDTGVRLTDQRSSGTVTKPRIDLYAAFCSLVNCADLRTLDVQALVTKGDDQYEDATLITIAPDQSGVYINNSAIEITVEEPAHDDDWRCLVTWYWYVPDVSPDWHALPNHEQTIGVTMDHDKWFRAEWDCAFTGGSAQRSLATTARVSLEGDAYTDDALISVTPPNSGSYVDGMQVEISASEPSLGAGWGCQLTWYWYVPDVSPEWHALPNHDQTIGVTMDHDKWFRAEWYCIYAEEQSYALHTTAIVQRNGEAPFVDDSLVSVAPDTGGDYQSGSVIELTAGLPDLGSAYACLLDWYWFVPEVSPDWHLLPNHAQTIGVVMDHDKWFRAEWRCTEVPPTPAPPSPTPTGTLTPTPLPTATLTPTPTALPLKQYCLVTLNTVGAGAITYGELGSAANATIRLVCDTPILLSARPHNGWRFDHFELSRATSQTTITTPAYELVVEEGDRVTAFFVPAADVEYLPLITR